MDRSLRHDRVGEHPTGDKSRHHKSQRSTEEVSRFHKEVSRSGPLQESQHAKLPKKIVAKPLNGDDDFVQRWLARTDTLTNQDEPASLENNSRTEHRKGQSAALKPKHRFDPLETKEALPPVKKRRRHSSSDSSILAVPIRLQLQELKGEKGDTNTRGRRDNRESDLHKRQRTEPSDSDTSDPFRDESPPPKEIFEKRARHKTRVDKYEPKEGDQKSRKDGTSRKPRRKTEEMSNGKKVARKSGEDLMNNFSSKSIGQERLTIRPPQGLGLFNNGRASSPPRRRGLSDLAFSEMNFLQNSSRQPQAEQKVKVNSKSREKEKRKATRAQDEITEFFRSSRKPLEETRSNRDRQASSARSGEEGSIYVKQVEQENRQQSYGDIRSLDSRERPLIGLRNSTPYTERVTVHHSDFPAITDPRRYQRSPSKLSEKATTYVSWSETQLSPSAKSYHQTFVDSRRASTTPESVRRSIEQTGIFAGTGIQRSLETVRRAKRERPPSHWNLVNVANHQTVENFQRITSAKVNLPDIGSRQSAEPENYEQRSVIREEARDSVAAAGLQQTSLKIDIDEGSTLQGLGTVRRRVVVEHYDPEHGWQAIDQSPVARCASADPPLEVKTTPASRQDLAKAARIKRPSTTLPLAQVSVEEKQKETPFRNVSQVNMTVVGDKNAHELVSIDQALPAENENTHDDSHNSRYHTEHEPIRKEEIVIQKTGPGQANTGIHSNSGFDSQMTRHDSTVHDPLEEFAENTSNSTYLGLPIRGSWNPSQLSEHHNARPMSDQPPFLIYQMKQESPLDHINGQTYPEVTDYEIYDIPEEVEADPNLETAEGYELSENHMAKYLLDVNEPNVEMDHEITYHDNDNNVLMDTRYGQSYNAYENSEFYELRAEDEMNGYQHDLMLEEELVNQELGAPFQVEEEDAYELYEEEPTEQIQGLWRPLRQY